MKRVVEDWSIETLYARRSLISFPEYQRQSRLWTDEAKRLLVDSILAGIDIPKIYFNKTRDGAYEVIDGQQRLWAIWDFLDDKFPYYMDRQDAQLFSDLSKEQQKTIQDYELQVVILRDAGDEFLRKLFLRLQLGLLLITGEKLHAATGAMKEFIFDKLVNKKIVSVLGLPYRRRYAHETLCAQFCINSFSRAKSGLFARTRYEDLEYFFKEYESPVGQEMKFFKSQTVKISGLMDELWSTFGDRGSELKNRSYILSVFLLYEEKYNQGKLKSRSQQAVFVDFVLLLWQTLRAEIDAGFERKNKDLYEFEGYISSAPGERYQIERRHNKLVDYYAHFLKTRKIVGER